MLPNEWMTALCLLLAATTSLADDRERELVRMVRNDCGSCHGLRLQGGLGPALLPETLSGKAPEAMRETILRGRTGTAMPPWGKFLNETEAEWIVAQLMKGFPQ